MIQYIHLFLVPNTIFQNSWKRFKNFDSRIEYNDIMKHYSIIKYAVFLLYGLV